jgi:16S rRNA (guanine966-N2)-methyltransferase
MRIIAGIHKGRPIDAPAGRGTRPTTDRVRESLFSSLVSLRGGLDGACVFDAFAGSGALSFEALSRGATFACMCEQDARALATLKKNAQTLRFDARACRIAKLDVMHAPLPAPPVAQGPYDLVFFDPPYANPTQNCIDILARLDASGMLASGAIAVYEHLTSAPDPAPAFETAGFAHYKSKKVGDTTVDIFTRA